MCGRYTLSSGGDAVADLLGLEGSPRLAPRYNIAPAQMVPAARIEAPGGRPELVELRWGLIPSWSKEAPGGDARMINARAETLRDKPSFRAAFRRRRCLIPADGFYEWKRVGAGKQPYLIRMADGAPFAFAGLWERWAGTGDQAAVESCTIVTTAPNGLVRGIHDRMPVILPPEVFPSWLDAGMEDPERLAGLLVPFPEERMMAYPVSPRVNNPRFDEPACVEPLAGGGPGQRDLLA